MTKEEYYREIEDIARRVQKEAEKSCWRIHEIIWEFVVSHELMDDLERAVQVLRLSNNADPIQDRPLISAYKEGGIDGLVMHAAFEVMVRDVEDALKQL